MPLPRSHDGSRVRSIPYDTDMTALLSQLDRSFQLVDNAVDALRASSQQLVTHPLSKQIQADCRQSPVQCKHEKPTNTSASKQHRKSSKDFRSSSSASATPVEALQEPSTSIMSTKPPKKQVRFDPVPRTESDEVYLGKPSTRFAEAKKKSAPKPKSKSISTSSSSSSSSLREKPLHAKKGSGDRSLPFAVGLSAVAALMDAEKRSAAKAEKKAAPAREKGEYDREPKSVRPKRKSLCKYRDGVYVEKRPRVVYGNAAVLGDNDWAMVRRRTVYGYRK